MLAEHQFASRNADFFGNDNFVRERVLQNAVLVNTGFVREGVGADNGLIGRNTNAGDLGKQAAGRIEFFEMDVRLDLVVILADVKGDDQFFERGVAGALADAVDGALDLPRARFDGGADDLTKIVDIGAAGILRRKFHFFAMRFAEADHFDDAVKGFLARGAQFVFQMQIRSGKEKMQAGLGGGFESFQRGIDIGLYGAGEGRYTAALEL